tara:strand:+ start:2586 stop:6713 length:4128 start_codon:yes stop_codon:yes gene_type:complete
MAEFDPTKPFTIVEPEPVEFDPTKPFTIVGEEEDESDQTVVGSIGRGVGAGLVNIAQGLSELGAAGLEATGAIDEGSQEATTEAFESLKDATGLRPDRAAGKVAETIATYATPGLGVFSWVSKADKARRALQAGTAAPKTKTIIGRSAVKFGEKAPAALTGTRAGRAALTTVGTGVADVLVSPSSMSTLADSWDAMPEFLRTEDEEGLTGKELTGVRLRNKFRLGLEGAGFNLGAEVVLPVVGATVKGIGQVPGVPALARGLSNTFDYMGDKILQAPVIGPRVKKYLTPDGLAPNEIMTALRTAEGMTEGQEKMASETIREYDKAVRNLIKFQGVRGLFRSGQERIQRTYSDTFDYLTGDMTADAFRSTYGTKVTKAADKMREQITDLSNMFRESIEESNLPREEIDRLQGIFDQNQATYIRRLYEINLRPEKFRGVPVREMPNYDAALAQTEQAFRNRNARIQSAIAAGRNVADRDMIVDDPRAAAEMFIDEQFDRARLAMGELAPDAPQHIKYITQGGKEVRTETRGNLFNLADGMLKDRSRILDEAPLLQEMMGVVRDPKEAFLRTVNDASNTIAAQRLYGEVARSLGKTTFQDGLPALRQGQRPIIDGNNLTDQMVAQLEGFGYVRAGELNPERAFGGKFGSLSGDFIPGEVYNSLTTPMRSSSSVQEALAVSLQLKGLSQMTKTVLNPLSQVRNFLSNTFVVGANGLLGRNLGLFESADVLVSNALESPEQFKLLRAMANEGAIGQNIQINEMRRLLQEQTELGVSARLNKAGNAFRQSKLGAPVRFMEKTYGLGDDYWKVVGALGEKARYGAALRKGGVDIDNVSPAVQDALVASGLAQRSRSIAGTEFGDLFAIDLVKQTMPTYSMVPEAIKALRRIPVVGNFMAFPAEIIRTSGNIVNRAIKEMGFKPTQQMIDELGLQNANRIARQVRGIGAQRLTGYISMAQVAPLAMRDAAHTILDVTPEEEALLEENSAYWTKGNTLMYLEKLKNGQADYADLSYMLPYEFMLAPARAALQVYGEKGEVGANEAEQIFAATWEGFKKFAEPFASEGLAAERVIDVTIRDGKTQTGAEIYETGEMMGDKLSKSLVHVAGAFMPGIIDQFTTIKGGQFVPGRATRAVTDLPSRDGDPYTIAEEAGTMLIGIRPMKLKVDRSLGYAGGEYSANRSSAVQIFTKVADDNDADVNDILSAYVQANEARRRHQAELRDKILKAQAAGMSRAEVFQAFKNTGVSRKELRDILDNKYTPIKVSRNLIREVAREVNIKRENRILDRVPVSEINAVRRSLIGTPIIGEREEVQETTTPVFDPTQPFTIVGQEAPSPSPTAPAPAPPQPTILQQVQDKTRTILGTASNPISALRDLEIFQSTRD